MSQRNWCYITVHPNTKVKIDKEDLKRVSAHKWRITRGTTGRPRVVTSVRGPNGSRHLTLGRFLMKPKGDLQVYPRRFNDGLDYRKENLIVCTVQERQRMLPKKRKASTSSFRGVSFSKITGKWRAGIEVDGISINLGEFDTEKEAALSYNKAAKKHFGVHAYQNQIHRRRGRRRDE